jgi:predicted transcriptional regulator
MDDLSELQPRLAACFDEVAQSRHGATAFSRTTDYTGQETGGTPVLVLEIETGPGRVRIVDAPVETQGGASDGLVACAQQVLRGRVVAAPGVEAGQRARLTYPLVP